MERRRSGEPEPALPPLGHPVRRFSSPVSGKSLAEGGQKAPPRDPLLVREQFPGATVRRPDWPDPGRSRRQYIAYFWPVRRSDRWGPRPGDLRNGLRTNSADTAVGAEPSLQSFALSGPGVVSGGLRRSAGTARRPMRDLAHLYLNLQPNRNSKTALRLPSACFGLLSPISLVTIGLGGPIGTLPYRTYG